MLLVRQHGYPLVLLETLKDSQGTLLSRLEQLVQLNCIEMVRTIDNMSGFLVISMAYLAM